MQSVSRLCHVLARGARTVHNARAISPSIQVASSSRSCSSNSQQASNTTHFGFRSVPEDEKQQRVHEVFSNVAEKYDLMNDAMSCGLHRLWKDTFVGLIRPSTKTRLLDVAGGTGDIAFRYLRHVDFAADQGDLSDDQDLAAEAERLAVAPTTAVGHDKLQGRDQPVVVCDINVRMLEEGKRRAAAARLSDRLQWVEGNAEALPFADNTFDVYTIAFGIRNVTHIDRALSEAHRVLRPGGRFLCLEFSRVSNPVVRWLYDEYSFQVIPPMGQVLAGDWHSYQYLVESIRRFPSQLEFAEMIRDAGFACVTHQNLTFGVVAIHSGFKLPDL